MFLRGFLFGSRSDQLWAMAGREYAVCRDLFGQRMVEHDRIVNFKPVILPLTFSFMLLWLSAVSLPESGPLPVLFRLAILPFLLANAFDIALNKTYSLGSPLRDVIFSYWGCLIVFKILDMAVLSLWDETPAPKWIKPRLDEEKARPTFPLQKPRCNHQEDKEKSENLPPNQSENSAPDDTIESHHRWVAVPHPALFSSDRALYGLDVVLLNRPGTPWLFPWRLRSLDWSLSVLNGERAGQPQFGQPEWPLYFALAQQLVHLWAHRYIRTMDLDGKRGGTQDLWGLKLHEQILITFAMGCIIALGSALEEAISFPLLIKFKILPPTALLASFRRALLANGLVELWGYRWHHNWRRSFVRTAKLFPAGLTSTGNALWTFFLSGILHSIMFARAYPRPTLSHPCSIIPIFWEPGMMIFFMSQGAGAMIEKNFLPKKTPSILRRIWTYAMVIGTGRHLANSMIVKGWLSADEWNQINYGAVLSDLFS